MTIYTATDLRVAAIGSQTGLLNYPLNCRPDRPSTSPERSSHKDRLRHILLGSPEEIRQAIHQLHVLNYVEPLLWSPIVAVGKRLVITPEQGEAMSLLRR
ncbi:hypothetical protein [cf. Phormidesmis sp. LEGE 11477]|uniref:hypothetical protein n=1 Tax=cf. Phormidesmis sp. LEGE 11477 TaxID=1828680 RepID=UPI001880B660|nr:hypothetical protein [cf. Phormidesmis sp. LEGE 11477]MBE9059892.1 hypothetical protein [cf. Phormidesmis sp. LEGE 11477]